MLVKDYNIQAATESNGDEVFLTEDDEIGNYQQKYVGTLIAEKNFFKHDAYFFYFKFKRK